MSKKVCVQCGKTIKGTNRKAEFLWYWADEVEAWLCGPVCGKKYNGSEDTPRKSSKKERS